MQRRHQGLKDQTPTRSAGLHCRQDKLLPDEGFITQEPDHAVQADPAARLVLTKPFHSPQRALLGASRPGYFVLNTNTELPIAMVSPRRSTCRVILWPFTTVPSGVPLSTSTYLLPSRTMSQ